VMRDSLGRIGVVFWKEVQDNWRDRRSVISAQLTGLIGPIFVVAMLVILGRTLFGDQGETPVSLPVQGAGNAPNLIAFLEQNGITVLPAPENPSEEVLKGNYDAILIISDDYGEKLVAGQPASVQLIIDSSRQSAAVPVNKIRAVIDGYSQQIGTLRLMARGIDPASVRPLSVTSINVATQQSQVFVFFNMLPYFVILVVFLGGMYVIIDTTAGERERGSLEPLLINPIPRWELILGKLSAAIPFATLTLFLTLTAFALTFNLFPMEDYIGVKLSLNIWSLVGIFALSLPMIVLASSLQMIIATFTHSFKEAQTYVGFLPLIPALPGIGLAFLPIRADYWNMLIPTFGQQLLINQILRGEELNPVHLLVSTTMTLLVTIVLILAAIKLYQREQVLFGGVK
jgi:sodium transport system permease protein